MTTPTRVQIAAALEELRDKGITEGGVRCALTAAAEAGEKAYTDLTRQQLVDEIIKLHDEAAATTERCAQIADKYAALDIRDNPAKAIAAEIRAMNEEIKNV